MVKLPLIIHNILFCQIFSRLNFILLLCHNVECNKIQHFHNFWIKISKGSWVIPPCDYAKYTFYRDNALNILSHFLKFYQLMILLQWKNFGNRLIWWFWTQLSEMQEFSFFEIFMGNRNKCTYIYVCIQYHIYYLYINNGTVCISEIFTHAYNLFNSLYCILYSRYILKCEINESL